ncbi:MAG: hypothetical protein CM1200mP22_32600 [Dehalococcoidia bacterium]|nr:MAG: hypothetical protein CM1200mP22_32600 [Dehalococcoidia bacterium]
MEKIFRGICKGAGASAFLEATKFIEEIGNKNIENQSGFGASAKAKLAAVPGVTVHSPMDETSLLD